MSKVDVKTFVSRLYIWSIVLYLLLSVLAGVFIGNTTYQLTVGHLAKDILASQSSAVLVPGSHALFDLSLRWTVVAIMLLSIIVPLLYLTRLKKSYEQGIKKRQLLWRWIDLGITTALIVEVIAILSGLQDVMMLKILAGLMIITAVLSWLAERAEKDGKKLVRPIFITSLVTGLLPWLLIAVYAVATPFYASVRAPWYVYAVYTGSLLGFGLLAYNQWRQHQKYKAWKDYWFVERNYAFLTLLTKVAFAVILIVGLKK